MGIMKSRQDWTIGNTVRVGFMTLTVVSFEPTPGDGMPDVYHLVTLDGQHKYTFQPHYGLNRE